MSTDQRLESLSFSDICNMPKGGEESFYRCEPVDAMMAKKDAALKSIRRWLQLWRTKDIDSISAINQIGIDLEVLENRK